jgi:hypothetical protein
MKATAEPIEAQASERWPSAGVRSAADHRSQAVPLGSVGQSLAGPRQVVRQQAQYLLEPNPERPAGLRSLPHTAVT